jgi:hypothetical protein
MFSVVLLPRCHSTPNQLSRGPLVTTEFSTSETREGLHLRGRTTPSSLPPRLCALCLPRILVSAGGLGRCCPSSLMGTRVSNITHGNNGGCHHHSRKQWGLPTSLTETMGVANITHGNNGGCHHHSRKQWGLPTLSSDNDGLMDVVSAHSNNGDGTVTWHRNSGGLSPSWTSTTISTPKGPVNVYPTDVSV